MRGDGLARGSTLGKKLAGWEGLYGWRSDEGSVTPGETGEGRGTSQGGPITQFIILEVNPI